MFWCSEAKLAEVIRPETGSHSIELSAPLFRELDLPLASGSSAFGFPEYEMVSSIAALTYPKVFQLISITPRTLRLYRIFLYPLLSGHRPIILYCFSILILVIFQNFQTGIRSVTCGLLAWNFLVCLIILKRLFIENLIYSQLSGKRTPPGIEKSVR